MFTETLVSPALGRELTCLLNDAHPGKYSGIRPKSIYSGESTLAAVVGETFESFLQIHPASFFGFLCDFLGFLGDFFGFLCVFFGFLGENV